MDEKAIKFQQISDTIFEDDNAALKLISLFESGKVDFKLATAIDNVIMDANMLREGNGEFLVHFNLLPEWEDKFCALEDFYHTTDGNGLMQRIF